MNNLALAYTEDIDSLRRSLSQKPHITLDEFHYLIECEVSCFQWLESQKEKCAINPEEAFDIWKQRHGDNFLGYWGGRIIVYA
ncbi:hypothetical protein COT99_01725 [Candidatus Falkowbacteria bacterium CG10_big_fil_rev_8_21_14_0_10_43_10]|uniref:Uncharacterized protein n=1 Tax=Candidatus Falkowbacteria bacterium CG10_big_fil_rev_8_21_14_0_10_43_10 TaxID=1974567 RepID=A0A2H0V4G9_9BACT|nr:MAG: hypothetical protein COT99_01725 [Candidatus Falkowbacteria bacterium CG10_big_fil_rev_8_21_14_0_10_43_10]